MISFSEKQITLFEVVVGSLVVVFSIINIGIYVRMKKSFSIKYDLLRDPNFRGRNWLQTLIKVLYYFELFLPVLLMIVLFLEIAVRDVTSGFIVLVNGMLLLSLIYLTNPSTFYIKIGIILGLLLAAELITLYLNDKTKETMYSASSAIFFSLNGILVSLALFANESIYWDLSEVCNKPYLEVGIKKVNVDWIKSIPQIVDGGIYGWFNKKRIEDMKNQYQVQQNKEPNSNQEIDLISQNCCTNCCATGCRGNQSLWFIIFYSLSLVTLILYAFQDWWFSDGWIGTISSGAILTFDLAIFILSSLSPETRTPFSLMIIIFVIRFFLFVFGNEYWFMGYCILYIIIGVFIAHLIIEKRFPKKKLEEKEQTLNALKTPQFMFILITTEFVIMIIALYVSNNKDITADAFHIDGQAIEFWSVGVISVFITFIIAFYMTTSRVLYRKLNKIQDKVIYYFFDESFTEYHMYLLVNYALVVSLGIYTYFKYSSPLSLTLCIFLPLIYLTYVQMSVSWEKNDYQIFVDKAQYKKKQKKLFKIKERKRRIMEKKVGNEIVIKQFREQQDRINEEKERMGKQKEKEKEKNENQRIEKERISGKKNKGTKNKMMKQQQQEEKKQANDEAQLSSHEIKNQYKQRMNKGFGHQPTEKTSNESSQQDILVTNYEQQLLTKSDIRLLVSIILFVLCNCGMIATSYAWCKSPVGLYISISLLSYLLQFSYVRYLKSSHDLGVLQLIGIIAGFLIGLIFWSCFWYESGGCFSWSIVFIILLSYLLVETLRNPKTEMKAYVTQIIQILLLMVFIVVDIYLVYNDLLYVIIVCGVIFYFILGLTFYFFFTYYNNSLPMWVYYSIAGIIGATFVGIIVATFFVKSISIFATFSIAVLLPIAGVVAFGWSQFYYRHYRRFDDVVIYSAYGLPAMRFLSEKDVLKKDEYYLYLYFIALMGFVVYGEITFFFFNTHINAGIYALCCFEVVGFISLSLIVMKNYYQIGKDKAEITTEMLKETFEILTQKYMPNIDDDENTAAKKEKLAELERYVEENPQDESISVKYDEIVHLHDAITLAEQEQQTFLFFWIGLIEFRIIIKKKQKMNQIINIVNQIKYRLEEQGIAFDNYEQYNDLEIRYQKLQNQIDQLDYIKRLLFDKTIEQYKVEKKKQKKEEDKLNKKQIEDTEKREILQRQKMIELMQSNKKQDQIGACNQGMVKNGYTLTQQDKDKIQAFRDQIKQLTDKNQDKYVDMQFQADNNSLGPKVIDCVKGWQRPDQNCKVIVDNVKIQDVKQGRIGDCYLISALGVLGDRIIKKALGMPYINSDKQLTKQKWPSDPRQGVFMVRFKKFRKNIFIKVDSKFPVDEFGNWVLGRCEDSNEIWVNIIQKAYAKWYGSYSSIFGGKAHFVMAEFTGGFPSQIILDEYRKNQNFLWSKLLSFKQNKYILAAGSPPGSDTSSSPLGILKGHAYAISDVREIQSHRLIKLKNPQGNKSKEWKGDFSDKSPLMNQRMKGLLGHKDEADGIFWMPLTNFLSEFKSLYICRQFQKDKWNQQVFKGSWQKDYNSFGNQKNKNIQYNPQYGITITQKCTLFINLNQDQDTSKYTSTGKVEMCFRLQKNNGKRIYCKDVSPNLLCNPIVLPTKNISLSNQYQLEQAAYPVTYTLMLYPKARGEQANFLVELYCNDKFCKMIDDAEFDKIKRASPALENK